MPKGGSLTITARADRSSADHTAVVVEIADSGVGIPERVLASVFEPFFTTRSEGTGLGLAIAKRYVEQNGGTIEISSVAGAGTTVRIRLPGIEAETMAGAKGPSAAPRSTAKRS